MVNDRYAAALKEKALRATEAQIRESLATRDAMIAVAYDIAEEQIEKGNSTYLDVTGIDIDDDPNHPTIMIFVSEKWQGNQEDHVLVMPLEEFAERLAEHEVSG